MSLAWVMPLHWGLVSQTINVSGLATISAEIGPIQGQGKTIPVKASGETGNVSGSGKIGNVGGSGRTEKIKGSGNICG